MDDKEKVEALQALQRVTEELDDAVFGDERQGRDGLVQDMKTVQTFILKWDKREYTVRVVFGLLSANIVLTVLGIIASFLLGGG